LEPHYGQSFEPPIKVNIPYPLFAKIKKTPRKKAENKQKVQGLGLEPANARARGTLSLPPYLGK